MKIKPKSQKRMAKKAKAANEEGKAVSPSMGMQLFPIRKVVFRDVVFGGICKRHKAK